MCSELYQYLTLNECQVIYKFNSLAAIKILLDTCQFPVILITEVYFLPHIIKIASYQLPSHQKARGQDFFSNCGYQKSEMSKKLGYNFVRLACEIISILAVVKPYKLFKSQEISESSDFAIALEFMKNQNWKQYDSLAFYSQNPLVLRSCYLEKLSKYYQNLNNYEAFIKDSLNNIIRKDLYPIGLDIRRLFQFYETSSCDLAFELMKEMINDNEAVTLINVIKLATDFVRWGNIKIFYLIEIEGLFDRYFQMIIQNKSDMSDSERGTDIFFQLEGLDQDRINLYNQLLRSLQVWTVCIAKDLIDSRNESKVTTLYKQLKNDLKVGFPYIGNHKKIRNESSENFEKFKFYNQKQIKFTKQNTISKDTIRRGSVQLKLLMNGTNKKNMKSIFNQTRSHNKNKSEGRSKFKQNDDSNSDIIDPISPNEIDKENSLLRSKIEKSSTFTETFFREKKKKKGNRSTTLTQEIQDLTTNNILKHLVNTISSQIDFPSGKMERFRWKNKISKEQDRDQLDDSWDTDYSEELQEEKSINKMRQIKEGSKKTSLKKPVVSFQEIASQDEYQTANFRSKVTIKPSFQKLEKDGSSVMNFFSESGSLNSSISNQSNFQSCSTPKIIVSSPNSHQLSVKLLKDDSIKEAQGGGSLLTSDKIFKKKSRILQYEQMEEKILCLEAEKAEMKKEIQKKEKEIKVLKSNEKKVNIQKEDSNFDWSMYLFSQEEINEDYSIRKKGTLQTIPESTFKTLQKKNLQCELSQLRQVSNKKLLKNKDILLKNDKIEIGFIFQRKNNYSDIIFFITPEKDLTKLKYYVKTGKRVSFVQDGEPLVLIYQNKQRKIKYRIIVQPPYYLPEFYLSYEMEGHSYNHNILIPISYNKFIEIEPNYLELKAENKIVRQTRIGMLNKNIFKCASQILVYFSEFKFKSSSKQEDHIFGSVKIEKRIVNLRITVQNNDFIQIEYQIKEGDEDVLEKIEFYILTLFYVMTK